MLINQDGSFVRDIDIYELKIIFGENKEKTVSLTKNKIIYTNTEHGLADSQNYSNVYSDIKEINITLEEFIKISDDIHNAGLCNILKPSIEENNNQALYCLFDDYSQYEYIISGEPAKEFNEIVKILSALFSLGSEEPILIEKEAVPSNEFYETLCCGVAVREDWSYCPHCGNMIFPFSIKPTEKTLDFDETAWICSNCNEAVSMKYKYCNKCGTKKGL